jgi:predicted Zn-dependent protease
MRLATRCVYHVASKLLSLSWRLKGSSAVLGKHGGDTDIDSTETTTKPVDKTHAKTALELRALLVRFPFWSEGHYLLAESALNSRDLATAYAATHCLRALCTEQTRSSSKLEQKNSTLDSRWRHLLGRCFLAAGDPSQALPYLQAARRTAPNASAIAEDEAAALMALGRNSEAMQALAEYPLETLSASGRVAAEYLRR